ncbi:hypothetical protein [Saccharopolyspora aridisoli]|uniref:hypothetical protein n=1 Tax=Saccharopolyspora aridisoli TaxID=2530385 RepID=UPI001F44D7FE|nr:hypothetical protein [Saccharopolyspora aridisoli]
MVPGRRQTQRVLGALLGDDWFGRPEHLPSAALAKVLGEFGVAEQAARAAIRRGRWERRAAGGPRPAVCPRAPAR